MSEPERPVAAPVSGGNRLPGRHKSIVNFTCDATYSAERFFVAHEVYDEGGGGYEEELHEGVVEGDEVHEQVQVPHAEDQQV